jgi:hypothetical protein
MVPLHSCLDSLLEVLQELDACLGTVDEWRNRLGIDKRVAREPIEIQPQDDERPLYQHVTIAPQQQRFWSYLFKELVDLLRPFCSGPKSWYLQDLRTMPQAAFDHAARLIHLSWPELYDDRPDLVKSRYYALT